MSCKQENNALLYAYGELEDAKTPAFLEHLKTCKECQNILHICALTTATLAPKQAPSFSVAEQNVTEEKSTGFNFGFLKNFKGFRWVYPALAMSAFALAIGFTAFEFTYKKPMVKVQTNTVSFEQVDTNLTDLETEFDDLFYYMQEF